MKEKEKRIKNLERRKKDKLDDGRTTLKKSKMDG